MAPVSEKACLEEIESLKKIIEEQSQLIEKQAQRIQLLEEEIARLKKKPKKPQLKPSKVGLMEKLSAKKSLKSRKKKRKKLKIHKTIVIQPENLPKGSLLLRYRDYIVQNICIKLENTRYRRPIYVTPDRRRVYAKLPSGIQGSRYGVELKAYILSLYHSMHVSQRDILSHLQEQGIEISAGQISNTLTQTYDKFHKEKENIALWSKALIRAPLTILPSGQSHTCVCLCLVGYAGARGLEAGLKSSDHIVVDDTGLRQNGKNGFCTHVGNERFAFFLSRALCPRSAEFIEILPIREMATRPVSRELNI